MSTRAYHNTSKTTLVISIGLYAISLTQQGYCISGACGNHWYGISLVAMGAVGGIMSIAGLTWYANPALWAAWSQIDKHPKWAVIFSFIGTLLAASFLSATKISDLKPNITSSITGYQPGYWLWLASASVMLTGSFITCLIAKNQDPEKRILIQVDFNKRYSGGVKLKTRKDVYSYKKTRIKLYYGIKAILWDKDYENKQPDYLAVEAFIYYNKNEKSWVARFDFENLMHESQREFPLLDN